ncbi:peptide ABC transporter substrate-binding protein [Streptomyces caniscabiei]|uniref:peptide ABC transporter substrate-binding protein n=1 Tax=Streptomyces caniscabiei TaxID=2746961 RepID=UPI0029B2EF64|nr:peptide ABC transporter substrate-binding protein [Streptomyces caniscabiei]MDX2775759.1 peptide ABC transporter substrate-binding protein [Streptomyces caniscabiei]
MADEKRGWKQFQNVSFDSKNFSKRVKKAEGATIRHAHKFILTRLDSIRSARRHIIIWLLLVGVIISAVGLQFMWFRQGYQAIAAADGGTYAEASIGPIDTLNPLFASTNAEVASSRLLFSSLFTHDKTGALHGDLATNMSVDDSGKVYTIKVRPDARWHDGQLLTAGDVAFTVDLMKNPQTRSSLRVNWKDVTVKAIDDTTVQFTLPAVYASFPQALTFSVLPKHILKDVAPGAIRENAYSRAPIGSGPFVFRLLQPAASANGTHKIVHMAANAGYYQGTPRLGRFEVHAYDSQENLLQALRTGEVSAAADVQGVIARRVDTHNYKVTTQPIDSGVYALLNNNSPILKDKTVRRALQVGTDTKAIRTALGADIPALSLPFINGQITGADVPQAPGYDEKKAAALLDEAGWKLAGNVRKKDGKDLAFAVTTTKDPQYEKALETLVGQWRKLGIVVSTNVVDPKDPSVNFVQNVLQARNYDVLLYELVIGADPDVYAYWHSSQIGASGYNFANYANVAADAALASARSRLEPELRNAKYKAFANDWIADAPAIGLYQSTVNYVSNVNVRSVDATAKLVSSSDRFSNVLYWSVNERPVYKTP